MARRASPLPIALHADLRLLAQLVERFFAEITTKRIRRGVFTSVGQLEKAIRDYLDQHNAEPKPFVWTKPADVILANEARALSQLRTIKGGNQALESEH